MKFILAIAASLLVFATPSIAQSRFDNFKGEILIPRTSDGDKGKYFLLESKRIGSIVATLHKRVGVSETGYSRSEINCKASLINDIGYGDDSIENITKYPSSKSYAPISGSSKSDLFNFVCSK